MAYPYPTSQNRGILVESVATTSEAAATGQCSSSECFRGTMSPPRVALALLLASALILAVRVSITYSLSLGNDAFAFAVFGREKKKEKTL